MATSMDIEIRKLRKKLRQIENLERLERDLTDEEKDKVAKTSNIRNTLQDLLSQLPESDSTSANTSTNEDDKHGSCDYQEPLPAVVQQTKDSDETMESEKRKTTTTVSNDTPQPPKIMKIETQAPMKTMSQQKYVPEKTRTQRSSSQSEMLEAQKTWRSSQFIVRELEGHNDIIYCVDCQQSLVVTGSRDTTVKVWNSDIGTEVCSFGGHNAPVTTVKLLSKEDSQKLVNLLTEANHEDDRVIISGSLDCSFKIWNIHGRELLKSVYVFNPVQSLVYFSHDNTVVTGSDGGKLELWDAATGDSLHSVISHDSAVTALQISSRDASEQNIASTFADGTIKIWTVRNHQLCLLFVSDDITSASSQVIILRKIHCLATQGETLYYGDSGVNVKVLNWKSAVLHKLKNHLCDFGSTDAMCICKDVMVCSGYDLDQGTGFINVWSMPGEHYLGTLNDKQTNHIYDVSCTLSTTGMYRIVTAGDELKVWDQLKPKKSTKIPKDSFGVDFNWTYTIKPEDSSTESEHYDSDDDDNERPQYRRQRTSSQSSQSNTGWLSWCSIL